MKIKIISLALLMGLGSISTSFGMQARTHVKRKKSDAFSKTQDWPCSFFPLWKACSSQDEEGAFQFKREYHWPNIFKATTIAVGIPVSLYAFAKNYNWLNTQFWALFKR